MRIPAAVALLALVSCAGPTRDAPLRDLAIPDRWSTPAPAGDSGPGWWKAFGDPRLDAFVEEALARHPDLRAAAARLEATVARARMAGADLSPRVEARLEAARRRQVYVGLPIPGVDVVSSTTDSFTASLEASWEPDLWGRLRAAAGAADAEAEASAIDLEAARLSLAARISSSWFVATEVSEQVRIASAIVDEWTATRDHVAERVRLGLLPVGEMRRAEAGLAEASAILERRRRALDAARRQLEVLAGRHPEGAARAEGSLPAIPAPVPAGLPSDLLTRRPDLAAAERRLAAAAARADEAWAARWPSIPLTVSGGAASSELGDLLDGDFRVWSFAARVLAPLFQGGRLEARAAASEAERRAVEAEFASRVLRAFAEVETALAAEPILARVEERVARAREEAEALRAQAADRLQRGVGGVLELREAARRVHVVDGNLLEVRRERLVLRVELHLALGGGFRRGAKEDSP